MFIFQALFFAAISSNFLVYVSSAFASCQPDWAWANNTLNQNPCEIAGSLEAPCEGFSVYELGPLTAGTNYVAPQKNSSSDQCQCNTVMYSLYSACTGCQNRTILTWAFWSQFCSQVYVTQYPNDIPLGAAVPNWAYFDVTVSGIFDFQSAKNAGDLPERVQIPPTTVSISSSKSPTPLITSLSGSSSSGSSSSTMSSSSSSSPGSSISGSNSGSRSVSGTSSPGSSSSSSSSPSSTPDQSSSSGSSKSKSSNTGAIAGGVVGGVAFIFIVCGGLIWYLIRRRRRNLDRSTLDSQNSFSAPSSQSFPQMRIYNPSDPSTYPPSIFARSGDSPPNLPVGGQYTGVAEL